ncbi:DUF808 family protein [Paenimyroides ceti]|uniref:DUF808 family protein n=1 Tax=Paenimyroides ceti TaxID=395087 RepID=UPI0037CAB0C7
MPIVIKILGIVGTIALILVSGGIFSHNIPFLHDFLTSWPSVIRESLFGIIAGTLVVAVVTLVKKIVVKFKTK